MTSEIRGGNPDLESRDPRIVRIGEEFYPFQSQRKNWHGYSYHLSSKPSVYTSVILEDGFILNLPFFTVADPVDRKSSEARLWIEADKNRLGELGLLKPSWEVEEPEGIWLPMPSLAFGRPRWSGHYIFDSETLEEMRRLRVQITSPEGEFEASPNIEHITGEGQRVSFAKGIDFTHFRDIHGNKRRGQPLSVDLKDEAFLSNIKAKFIARKR